MPNPIGQLRTLMINVENMDQACAFYRDTMCLPLRFRDGDRWAVFDAGGITLALAGKAERSPVPIALNFKVVDVEAALEQVCAGGGRQEGAIVTGEHERRVAVRDCDGHLIHLYSPIAKA